MDRACAMKDVYMIWITGKDMNTEDFRWHVSLDLLLHLQWDLTHFHLMS